MSAIRVLRIYHSAVVAEFRLRERLLEERHGYEMHLVVPPAWTEGGVMVEPGSEPNIRMHVVDRVGPEHPILFRFAREQLAHVFRTARPHVLDIHEEPYSLVMGLILGLARREAPGAHVCVYSAQNIRKRYPPPFALIERRALRAAGAAYPCSTEAAEVLRSKGFAGTLNVLPLGVSEVPPEPREPGPLRVGFVGRLEPYKGARLAIAAFAEVAADRDAVLEILGTGSQEDELRELASSSGLGERIVFRGSVPQEQALRVIRDMDVLVVPSLTTRRWKEQFGRVVAQAFAARTAVIASDSGSLPETIAGCGVIVPEGDVSALAAALSSLLGDRARREELVECGLRRAREELSWERVADGSHAMYQELLAAGGSHE